MSTTPSKQLLTNIKVLADQLYRATVVGPTPSREQLAEWERLAQAIEDALLEMARGAA